MSKQGTWADHVNIQGVADILNLKISIIESDPNFADLNIMEATNSEQQCVTVSVGHVDEVLMYPLKNLFQIQMYSKQVKTPTIF